MKISKTAAFIAVKLFGLSRNTHVAKHFSPFVIGFYEKLVQALPQPVNWYYRLLQHKLWRRFFIFWEETLLPGDLMHILCRKYFVQQLVDQALRDGYEQVVNLGAGFDHLGAYLSQQGVSVFELDKPDMVQKKQHFLEAQNFTNLKLHFIPCDVTQQRMGEALRAHPEFYPQKKTLFVAEGFFDYLALLPSEHLLEDIKALNFKNRLVSTFFSLDELNLFHETVFRSGVTMVGESLQFKITRDDFVELLEELGFELQNEITHRQMKKEFVPKTGLNLQVLKGFYLFEFKPRA